MQLVTTKGRFHVCRLLYGKAQRQGARFWRKVEKYLFVKCLFCFATKQLTKWLDPRESRESCFPRSQSLNVYRQRRTGLLLTHSAFSTGKNFLALILKGSLDLSRSPCWAWRKEKTWFNDALHSQEAVIKCKAEKKDKTGFIQKTCDLFTRIFQALLKDLICYMR